MNNQKVKVPLSVIRWQAGIAKQHADETHPGICACDICHCFRSAAPEAIIVLYDALYGTPDDTLCGTSEEK